MRARDAEARLTAALDKVTLTRARQIAREHTQADVRCGRPEGSCACANCRIARQADARARVKVKRRTRRAARQPIEQTDAEIIMSHGPDLFRALAGVLDVLEGISECPMFSARKRAIRLIGRIDRARIDRKVRR